MTEAVVRYDPNASVGNANNLKGLLERSSGSIRELLPKHVTPERLTKLLLVAANRNPAILSCTQASVVETVMRAAELGLDFGQLGGAHAVPFGNKLQLIPDYRGLVKLVRQSGELSYVGADVVYDKDSFVYQKGSSPKVEHVPKLDGDRGRKMGAYAVLLMKDGSLYTDYMNVAEIEAIRSRSKAGKSGPWVTDWDEMAKKTVLRKTCKLAPMSSELLSSALEIDNEAFEATSSPIFEEVQVKNVTEALDRVVAKAEPKVEVKAEEPAPPAGDLFGTPPQNTEPLPPSFMVPIGKLLLEAKAVLGMKGKGRIEKLALDNWGVSDLSKLTEEQYINLTEFLDAEAMVNG